MSGLDKFNIPRLIQDTLRKGTELVSAVVGKWNVVLGAIREKCDQMSPQRDEADDEFFISDPNSPNVKKYLTEIPDFQGLSDMNAELDKRLKILIANPAPKPFVWIAKKDHL